MPIHTKAILCALFTTIFFNLGRANNTEPIPFKDASTLVIAPDMAGKVTFRVDMRNETVAPDGVFFAANFFFTIGFSNWTFLPMCDLGQGIWAISFVNVPPGLYQYKYVNGIFPSAGWEFQGSGGPCTNPADNNNRFVTITGGIQTEGPFCFESCDMVCAGNAAVTPNDMTPPTIDMPVPDDVTLECDDIVPPLAALDASDACDANATTTTGLPTQTSVLMGCAGRILTRRWTVTDCAGNTTTAQQTITIADTTPPTINANPPATITAQCGSVPAPAALAASDNCDASITSTGLPTDMASGSGGPCGALTIIRRWTVTDCSGNSRTRTQVITLTDNTAPVFSAPLPANITVSCGSVPAAVPIPATDACDPLVTMSAAPIDNTAGLNACGIGQIIRSWTVTDCSGNTATRTQQITVTDNVFPTITGAIPPGITLQCGTPLPIGVPLAATDNCTTTMTQTNPPIDNTSGLSACGLGLIVRTWTISDCTGNAATATQPITIVDNTPPVITQAVPPDITISCEDLFPYTQPLTASDNCTTTITVTNIPTDNIQGFSICGTGQVIRTWLVTDCAGNSATASQTITVTDFKPPVFVGTLPNTISLSCEATLPPLQPLSVTENCTGSIVNSNLPTDNTTGINTCGIGQIIRTWTAVDCSGNSASYTQIINIIDNTPPTITGTVPPDTTLNCGLPIPLGQPLSAMDNCLSAPTLTSTPQDNTSGLSACGTGQIIRSWSVTDCAGNTSVRSQIITIVDNLAPIFTNTPSNISLCPGSPVPPMEVLNWTDNCSNATGTTIGIETINGNNITRTWTQTDACGNTATTTQTIQFVNAATANIGNDQTICAGQNIALNPNFTTSLTSFQWSSNGNGTFSNPTIANPTYIPGSTDLTNGSTQLIVAATGSGGICSQAADTILFTYATIPTANAGTAQTRTCNNPTVTLGNIGGATTGLSFLWAGNGINTTNNTAPTPAVNQAGTYTVTVTETTSGVGCSATATVTVSNNTTPPIANAGIDKTITCSQNSVTLDGTGSSTGANITYQWSSGDLVQNPQVSAAGTYTVTVTNTQNGCTATDQVIVTADAGLPIANAGTNKILTCTVNSVVLNGQNSSQGAGIQLTWTNALGTPIGTNNTVTVNTPGTYTLRVSNNTNGCTAFDDVLVTIDTIKPNANAGPDVELTCTQANTTLNGNNSSTDVQYSWTGPGIVGTVNQPTVLASIPGQYLLTVTNPTNGCSDTDQVTISPNANIPLATIAPSQAITCLNSTVILQGSSSILGGTFLWTGPGINTTNQTLPNPTVNQPGNYTLVVTNPTTGCSSSAVMATVTDNRILPNFTLTTSGQLNCVTTQVTLTGTNSSTNNVGPFTYRWFRNGQLIAGASDSIITASSAGTYRLEITNTSDGCSSAPQLVLLPPPVSPSDPPVVIIVDFPTNILTCKTPVITLGSILIFTGTTPYTVQWTTLDGALSPSGGTVNKPDTYILTVTDLISGCVGRDTVLILEDKTPPILTINQNLVLGCLNNSVPLSSTVSGTAPFTYQWSGPSFQSTLPEPSATSIGLYRVTVTQANGCEAKATLQVTQSDSTISVDLSTQPACVDGMNGVLIVENTTGTNPPFQYSVDGGAWQDSTRFDGLKAGDYTLTIQDKEGCSFDTSFTIPPAKVFTVDLPDQIIITLGDSVQLIPVLSDPGSAYNWSNPISLSCPDCFSPFAQPFENTNYTITVTNENGCTTTASAQVIVRVESNEYAPNVFDPSSEAPNNRFVIYTGNHVRNVKSLEIFDRWGELVFRSNNYPPNDPAGGWDGTTRSKKCVSGIYVFVARLELINGTEKVLSGDVLLVR
jgi:hypothetical protein